MTKKVQYIITDPCYIIDDDTWHNCWSQTKIGPDDEWDDDKFNSLVSEALNKLAGTTNAVACHTGFGDWSNCMHCSNDAKIIESDFFADSGMVCVVEYNDAVKKALAMQDNAELISRGGAALIETEGEVHIEMDTNDLNWTVVYIEDDVDSFNSCLPYDEDEDED